MYNVHLKFLFDNHKYIFVVIKHQLCPKKIPNFENYYLYYKQYISNNKKKYFKDIGVAFLLYSADIDYGSELLTTHYNLMLSLQDNHVHCFDIYIFYAQSYNHIYIVSDHKKYQNKNNFS